MSSITLSSSVDARFEAAPRVTVGDGVGPAEMYALVSAGQRQICIDIRPHGPQAYPFRDAMLWKDLAVIGYGSALYVVRLEDLHHRAHRFAGYFGSLNCSDDFCLAAGDDGILRLSEDGTALWFQRGLAADGIRIMEVSDGVIRGQGQWDPPDGAWTPFRLELATGRVLTA